MDKNAIEIMKQELLDNILDYLGDNGHIEISTKGVLFDKIIKEDFMED